MFNYELDDGEERHKDAPATFDLPSIQARSNLKLNDLVKLIFRIEHDGGFDVERMWVIIQETTPTGYIGVLDNDAYCTNELQAGAIVAFQPRHIIQIY